MYRPDSPPHPSADSAADVHPLRDASGIECSTAVELIVFRFSGFGRLAHFRRWLTTLPQVRSARIVNYGGQTASFELGLAPGTPSGALVPPGTRLIGSDGHRIELCVEPS